MIKKEKPNKKDFRPARDHSARRLREEHHIRDLEEELYEQTNIQSGSSEEPWDN